VKICSSIFHCLSQMNSITYTLLSDGPFDIALRPILTWLLITNGVRFAIQAEWADLRTLKNPPTVLAHRISAAIQNYPCDLVFIHRDAERQSRTDRVREIRRAIDALSCIIEYPPYICVIPVRMTEAWLFFEEQAIRTAAGNSHGRELLDLPPPRKIESLPDPKSLLYDLLRSASGLRGRRLNNMPVSVYAARVSELIEDFSPLRQLSAFSA